MIFGKPVEDIGGDWTPYIEALDLGAGRTRVRVRRAIHDISGKFVISSDASIILRGEFGVILALDIHRTEVSVRVGIVIKVQ
jgi:hypothetical protein